MPVKMKMLPEAERPYEKLEMYGEASLSNSELLAIIIKNGTKEENSISLAQKILSIKGIKEADTLRFLKEISIQEYMSIKGIGKVKAIQLKAVCELARRMSRPINNIKTTIRCSKDVADLLMEEMRFEKRELVKEILLNSKNKIVKIIDLTMGGTSSAIIEPKDVLVEPIKWGVPRIILVHNHPSGDPTPSNSDIEATKRILKASNIVGIELLDHVVIGDDKYESIFSKEQMKVVN